MCNWRSLKRCKSEMCYESRTSFQNNSGRNKQAKRRIKKKTFQHDVNILNE